MHALIPSRPTELITLTYTGTGSHSNYIRSDSLRPTRHTPQANTTRNPYQGKEAKALPCVWAVPSGISKPALRCRARAGCSHQA